MVAFLSISFRRNGSKCNGSDTPCGILPRAISASVRTSDTLLMELLAIRLGEQTTLAKSLVMAQPADCGRRCDAGTPAPDACTHRVIPPNPCSAAMVAPTLVPLESS